MASVKSQWLKRTVLQRNLPVKQKEDVMALLTLSKTEGRNDIYLKIKTEHIHSHSVIELNSAINFYTSFKRKYNKITFSHEKKTELLRIYSEKPPNSYKKALTRQMTGLLSQLGYQIINDICTKTTKLDGCCCEAATMALWSMSLLVNIRAHISNMSFTKDTYKSVFEAADRVFLSAKQVTVASMSTNPPKSNSNQDETLPAFSAQNQPQVATISRGQGTNKGNREGQRGSRGGNRGGNRGGQSSNSSKPRAPRHASLPPESCCDRHYAHGDQATA